MIRTFLNKLLFLMKNNTCKLGNGVMISRKARVGKNCKIGKNSAVSANVVLGDNVIIGDNTKLRNIQIDDNTMVESGVIVVGPGEGFINIGKECYIGVNNILDTSDNIRIGDFVHIAGPSTALWCHSSAQMCLNSITLNDKNRQQYRPTAPIEIENNVYIGGNCTIYPGVYIGHHSIIAPNTAVTKKVNPQTFLGGVPGKFIKKLV